MQRKLTVIVKLQMTTTGIISMTDDTWNQCVKNVTDEWLAWLSQWRGYSLDFCNWLRNWKMIGVYYTKIALPVHDQEGNVVGVHYRTEDGNWRYEEGIKAAPLSEFRKFLAKKPSAKNSLANTPALRKASVRLRAAIQRWAKRACWPMLWNWALAEISALSPRQSWSMPLSSDHCLGSQTSTMSCA